MTAPLLFALSGTAFLIVLWAIQLRTQDAATADIGWATLVATGTVVAAWTVDGDLTRRLLVAALAVFWSLRLALYLLRDRVLSARGEDGRYRALREHLGPRAALGFLGVYLAQGFVAALFLLPIVAAMQLGALSWWAAAGVAVWLAAVGGEWLADRQLAAFRADPSTRGTVCRTGLWKYSRHPNYFFEWLHWWAYVLIAEGALLTFVGPLFMLIFLFRITGIPYTERQALRSRGDAYREYQRTTSVFVPWPPHRVKR